MFISLIAIVLLIVVTLVPSQVNAQCMDCVPGGIEFWMCQSTETGYEGCVPMHLNNCRVTGSSCPGSGCFLAGIQVSTPNGATSIEQLSVGDAVLSWGSDGQVNYSKVSKVYRTLAYEYLVINGRIRVTGSHPFKVGHEWRNTVDLRVGDVLTGEDGKTIYIVCIEKVDKGVRVFNIEVDGNHTFFADGLLVHNKEDPLTPQG
ncbi:MAG: hypothetical protein GY835_04610 [bacterium]|nr:hypothetical protein [bacterium]